MSTVTKVSVVNGEAGVVMTAENAIQQINKGQQFNLHIVKRVFLAGDVGNGNNQTQNANGCIAAAIESGRILGIAFSQTYKVAAGVYTVNTNWIHDGTPANSGQFSLKISDDGKSVTFIDKAGNAATQIAANDLLMVGLIIGNTEGNTYIPR